MSNASKTRLPAYSEGATKFYAARITAIEHFPADIPGCKKLKFGGIGKEANVRGDWIALNSPVVGGYFVLPETGGAMFMREADFNKRFPLMDVEKEENG